MKRILAILLMAALCIGMCACNGDAAANGENNGNEGDDCTEHVDKNGDSICDNCNAKVEAGDESDSNTTKKGNKVGDLCHSVNLESITSGEAINIENYRGKVVVINFWGTWCKFCLEELPDFNKIADEMANDVAIIGVHTSYWGEVTPESYIDQNYKDSKIIFAFDRPLSASTRADMYYSLLGGNGYYPYTLVLDADGVITYSSSGALTYEQLSLLIEDAKS